VTTPTFSGEVQFAGYSDSSRSGPRVTLRLQDRAELEKFVGCEGKRYMAVLVEIGDDEAPAQPACGGERAKWAAMRCAEPEFQRWLSVVYPEHINATMRGAELCAEMMRTVCAVKSRAEFDSDEAAGYRFDSLIRRPWSTRKAYAA
jgi:hypothetical protein